MPSISGFLDNIPKAGYYLALALLTFALGIFTVNQFRLLYLANTEPVTFHDMIIDPSVIAPGDPLFVTAVLTRHRFCWSERTEWVADVATNTNQWEGRFPNASTALGYVRIRNKYSVPVLEPGEYVLRMVALYRCNAGDHTIKAPEAFFSVVEAAR